MRRSEDIRRKKMAMENMMIKEITENKKEYLNLLLLADEQEDMIDRYLDRGRMYVLEDNGVKCECVVTDEGNGILEIKNITFDIVTPFSSVTSLVVSGTPSL